MCAAGTEKLTGKLKHQLSDARRRCAGRQGTRRELISAKVGDLEERLSMLLSSRAKEMCHGKADTLKVLLGGVETRFEDDHAALVDAMASTPRRRGLRQLCWRFCAAR